MTADLVHFVYDAVSSVGPTTTQIKFCGYRLSGISTLTYLLTVIHKQETRKLSYRKDDHAMHPIYGCPKNFWESLDTPTPCSQKF